MTTAKRPWDGVIPAEEQWNPASAKARYDWIYNYDATQVPV